MRYRYRVGDRTYVGARISFGDHDSGDADAVSGTVDAFPVGATVAVAYDPHDPARSVLRPGDVGSNPAVMAFGSVLAGGGGVVLVRAGWRSRRTTRSGPPRPD